MIVNKERRWVFVQTPKTGTTSIKQVLQKYQDYPRIARHAPLAQILDHYRELDGYLKVGFTRDRDDWLRSCYRWARRKQDHPAAHRNMTYEEWLASDYHPNWWHRDGISKYMPAWADVSPDDWVQGCDLILRFETLSETWPLLCQRLGIPHEYLPHMNRDKHK